MQQIFPIFNPVTQELIGYKERGLVHRHGDWHKGIQANVLRKNSMGSFDILIQERSATVDIGRCRFDQSLATQMLDLDGLDELKALRRGLLSELSIRRYRSVRIGRDLRIAKTYNEHLDVLNREIISIFLVEVDNDEPVAAITPKIKQLVWMPWDSFLEFFTERMTDFTKTAQFYFGEPDLLQQIRDESFRMLSLTPDAGTEKQEHITSPPLIRIDRWPAKFKTYQGNIARALSEAGELDIVSY